MAILSAIPLFAYLWVIINGLLLFGGAAALGGSLFNVALVSGAAWSASVSDLFIVLGVLALYIEVFKATRTGTASVIDHTLSMMVFVAFLVEFLVYAKAGNSTFVILGLMSLLDVVAGFTITIVAARRDLSLNDSVN
ncbi:hypothetical protein [Endothiovibrio diazotrophicus]